MLRSSSGLTCCCLAIALSLPGSWASAQDEPYSNTQGTANDYEFLLSLPTDGTGPEPAPWQGTLELNDTGVDDGSELRQWLSIQKMDLFAPLDFFAVDVSTDSFDQYHSLSLQYETAPLMNDLYLAFDALHSRDQIDAVETDDTLDDVTTGAGLYLMHLAYLDEWLVSAGPGIRWLEIETDKLRIYEGQGENTFLLPGLQLRWQHQATGHASTGYIHYEWNEPDAADTRRTERPARVPVNIGGNVQLIPVTASIDIDTRFRTLLLDYEHRLYLGPDNSPGHYQLVFNGLLQSSGGEPLLPSFQRSVGGTYSVRGYDDQVLSGNEVIEASLAYRFVVFTQNQSGSPWQPWLNLFYDWARVQTDEITVRFQDTAGLVDRTLVVPENSRVLRSAGIALDLHHEQRSVLYIALARALANSGDDPDTDTESGDWRAHAYLRFHF